MFGFIKRLHDFVWKVFSSLLHCMHWGAAGIDWNVRGMIPSHHTEIVYLKSRRRWRKWISHSVSIVKPTAIPGKWSDIFLFPVLAARQIKRVLSQRKTLCHPIIPIWNMEGKFQISIFLPWRNYPLKHNVCLSPCCSIPDFFPAKSSWLENSSSYKRREHQEQIMEGGLELGDLQVLSDTNCSMILWSVISSQKMGQIFDVFLHLSNKSSFSTEAKAKF